MHRFDPPTLADSPAKTKQLVKLATSAACGPRAPSRCLGCVHHILSAPRPTGTCPQRPIRTNAVRHFPVADSGMDKRTQIRYSDAASRWQLVFRSTDFRPFHGPPRLQGGVLCTHLLRALPRRQNYGRKSVLRELAKPLSPHPNAFCPPREAK